MTATLEILVGMVASGKSTYARKRAQEGAVIVCDDAIVLAVHGGDYALYRETLKPLYKSTEAHIAQMALALGRDVVVDRGVNVSLWSRRRWIGLARSLDVLPVAVVFPNEGPLVHAERRFQSDPRGHNRLWWLKAAQRHDDLWELPTYNEGLAEIKGAS